MCRWINSAFGLFLLVGCWNPTGLRAQETSLDPSKALTQYVHQAWNADDGLPQNTIQAIVQTRDGYLWLGTEEGLARFDGVRFTVFDKSNTPAFSAGHIIRALFEDQAGTLWIGTTGSGLVRFSDGQFIPVSEVEGVAISSLVQDASGTLWVGTWDAGLFALDNGQVVHYTTDHGLASSFVSVVYEDRAGTLWVGTREGLHHLIDGQIRRFEGNNALSGLFVTALYEDREGTLWIGTRDGLDRLEGEALLPFSPDAGWTGGGVRALWQDDAGSLWMGTTQGGLGRLRAGQFDTFTSQDGLTSNSVLALSGDREGHLWIGTERGGLNRFRDGKFTPYTTREGLSQDMAFAVYEDADGVVWIGTDGGGLNRLHDGTVTTYTTRDGLSSDIVMSIYGDRNGALWVGTDGGLNRFKDGVFTPYTDQHGLPGNAVSALFEGADGSLWIGTDAGLTNVREGHFTTYTADDGLGSNFVTTIHEDRHGDLWVGTYDAGLRRLHDGVFTAFTTKEGLAGNLVLAIHEDAEGTLWIGTYGDGLSRLKDGRLTTFTTKDGLFDDSMYQILEDEQGNFWMSCNKGIFRVSKADLNALADGQIDHVASTAYGKADGLKSPEFNGGFQPAGWKSRDGKLWFPSVEGVAMIDPANIRKNTLVPPVLIEDVIADQEHLDLGETLELAPGKEKIEFHYTALSFVASEEIPFRYILDGYNATWQEAGANRIATYTNLDPGTYTFRVKARNRDGVWNETGASVSFYLKPFFYQTTWFLILCVIGVILLALGGYKARIRQLKARERQLERTVDERTRDLRRAKERVEKEKEKTEQAKAVIEAQADKLRELDRFKTRFFANVSHEFRTPLTMIVGPLENAINGAYGHLADPLKRQAEIMLRNALRLMRLINQLLDLSKLEAGKMQLKAGHRNIVEFLDGVLLTMTPLAEQKGIDLQFEASASDINLYFEPDKFEKVFYNLLSNASKFTPRGGTISTTVRELAPDDEAPEGWVEICVADTGKGIPEDQLPHIFDRFHQVDGSNTREHEGTGIGLALVKEMIELHGGRVSAESAVGVGTAFTILLKKGDAHLAREHVATDAEHADVVWDPGHRPLMEVAMGDAQTEPSTPEATHEPAPNNAPLVLVVDDNKDVREYVGSILGQHYQIATAQDGQDGLDQAALLEPDLIISDVMMPKMDGNALCRALKSNEQLKHIPLILLTARATHELRIESLEGGADDYMAKPFNARELLARVRNLLTIRQQQKELLQFNEDLREINRTLRQVSEVKTQVLRMAAHDLKNPLFVIREFVEIVQEEIGDQPGVDYWLQSIHTSSERMLEMTTQLLDSSALESGMIRLNAEPVRLGALIEEVIELNQRRAEAKGQTLHLTIALDDDNMIEADRGRLLEVMDNLVSNAIKYSPLDKSIWITVAPSGDEVHVSVRDEGPGLTELDKQKVFGRFQRLSAVPTGEESSTGLGLSIVKQIVALHGGQVWVESEAGHGATFTVALKQTLDHTLPEAAVPQAGLLDTMPPVTPESIDEPEAARAATSAHADDMPLVLLVEDHDAARKHVSDILQEHYRVVLAANGWEALEKTRALEPDLIVSDVIMPVMDGHALCEEIKKDPALSHIPVILMTAWATRASKMEGLEAGADDFIAKPFHAHELLTRSRNLITLRQQEKEVKALHHALQTLRDELDNQVPEKVQALLAEQKHDEAPPSPRQSKARSGGSARGRKPTAP